MNLKDQYKIQAIDYKTAMGIVIKEHYLHRSAPCSFAFGLFESNKLIGVIIYGTPSSAPLRRGICGDSEKNNVIELTRLWIQDDTPKNTESYFIGNTIKLIDKEIVVSYAEIEQGHLGVIYQATNWIYTGLSAKRTNWTIEGIDKHCQTLADKYTAKEIREKYGDKFKLVDRPRKHRYVYFNSSKKRKIELLQKLNYKIEPYPKKHTNGKKKTNKKIRDQQVETT
ncbi:hypothetical protein LCGC14_0278720 [marine sediment metagenome]|uniref:Uncharacterized protein n=1 Tax=marine sediment metagenome TaxID=412755 RepID=A0A0F9U1V5_9ZZZZ